MKKCRCRCPEPPPFHVPERADWTGCPRAPQRKRLCFTTQLHPSPAHQLFSAPISRKSGKPPIRPPPKPKARVRPFLRSEWVQKVMGSTSDLRRQVSQTWLHHLAAGNVGGIILTLQNSAENHSKTRAVIREAGKRGPGGGQWPQVPSTLPGLNSGSKHPVVASPGEPAPQHEPATFSLPAPDIPFLSVTQSARRSSVSGLAQRE